MQGGSTVSELVVCDSALTSQLTVYISNVEATQAIISEASVGIDLRGDRRGVVMARVAGVAAQDGRSGHAATYQEERKGKGEGVGAFIVK